MDIQEIMSLVQKLKASSNPNALLLQMAQENPIVAKAIQMTQGKSLQQQFEVASNYAKTAGKEEQLNQLKGLLGGM